jgi:hypothetical protein
MSIEEIFNSVSSITSGDINPPPPDVVLTPRSAEACLRLGLNPETLRIRDLESFQERGMDPTVQRMRHEAYSERRHSQMKVVRAERKEILNRLARESKKGGEASMLDQILEEEDKRTQSLLLMEAKRLENVRQRQEKQLEQMLQVHEAPQLRCCFV